MKSHLSLLGLAAICSLFSISLTGCAEDYYGQPVVYAPVPPIIPFFGWGGAGFYGGSYYGNGYNNGYNHSHYSNGGYYNNSRGGSASWGGGSGSWHGAHGRSGSWHH